MVFAGSHLKQLEGCQQLPRLLASPVDLEPLERGRLVALLAQADARLPDGATKELSLADLEEKVKGCVRVVAPYFSALNGIQVVC